MTQPRHDEEIERMLSPRGRAHLPFRRMLVLYLDPFSLFKDASRGPDSARRCARSYNRAMRWMLLTYVQRWMLIAVVLFACTLPAEALAATQPMFKIPAAAFAVGSCIAVAVIAWTIVAYFLLDSRD